MSDKQPYTAPAIRELTPEEVVKLIKHLSKQVDDLQTRNTALVEENRKVRAENATLKASTSYGDAPMGQAPGWNR